LDKKLTRIQNKQTGLALGGGAVLGAAHIGVIRAIDEYDVPIDYISGTSIGSLIAALYSFGITWKEMGEIALELDWFDISQLSLSRYGLLTNKKIGNVILDHLGDVQFSDSEIPLAVIATDLASGKKIVISEGSVADAVMASTCIPGVFVPIEKGDRFLIDGGVMENVPVLSVQEMGADFVIGVDLNAKQSFIKPNNVVEVLINTINLTLVNVTKLQTEEADLLITPDLSQFNLYDTNQVSDLIEEGYRESKKRIKKYFNT
jgi:NTE family protein